MRSAATPPRRILTAVSMGALALSILACPSVLLQNISSTAVRREAESLYDFGPERPPLRANDPAFKGPVVPDGEIPRMWISTATLKPNVPVPKDRIIARIRSERAYPLLGIAAGENYVWRNSRDARRAKSWVTLVVAADSALARHTLKRDERLMEYTHGEPAEPRLVILQVHSQSLSMCLDDPMCSTGHCGYY